MTHSQQYDPTPTDHDARGPFGRALVLGGGGAAGNAWLIGVIAGLHEAGLDVTDADLVVGTSAGATAAAMVTSASPARLLAEALAAPAGPARPGRSTEISTSSATDGPREPVARHLDRIDAIIAESSGLVDMRRRMGAALQADPASQPPASARWRATVAARLPSASWPDRRVLITAVDASTGEPVVLDRHSGVDLVDAVAASCAGGFAYAIDGRGYIDGGYRSNADNADLAAGCARVLVLSPLGGRTRTPAAWGTHLATQVDALRAGGAAVETVFPDSVALAAFGDNLMDPSTRPAAAHAGYEQGVALAAPLAAFWRC